MAIGARDFPNQMGPGSSAANFTAETRFGFDWLQAMWDDGSKTFYYQVGIGNGNSQTVSDHDIWRLPQADDTYDGCTSQYRYICHRPVFINTAGGAGAQISPNLAGRSSAPLWQCATTLIGQAIQPMPTNACFPRSTSSIWQTPLRAETSLPQFRSASIQKRNGATTSNSELQNSMHVNSMA